MRIRTTQFVKIALAGCLLNWTPVGAQQSALTVDRDAYQRLARLEKQAIQARHAEHESKGSWNAMVAPGVELRPGCNSELILLNTSRQVIPVEVTLHGESMSSDSGEAIFVEPGQHYRVRLRKLLRIEASQVQLGTLRLNYHGVPGDLQGWIDPRGGHQHALFGLLDEKVGDLENSRGSLYAWDLREHAAIPEVDTGALYLYNPIDEEVRVLISASAAIVGAPSEVFVPPRGARIVDLAVDEVSGQVGWLRVGQKDQHLVSSGFILKTAQERLRVIPEAIGVMSPRERVTVGLSCTATSRHWLSAANLSDSPSEVALFEMSPAGEMQRARLTVPPNSTEHVFLTGDWISSRCRNPQSGQRTAPLVLRIEGEGTFPRLVSSLGVVLRDDFLFPMSKAHGSGTYPLFPSSSTEVETVFFNAGASSAWVVGQVEAGNGVERTIGPFEVTPGGQHVLRWANLLGQDDLDLMGRALPEQVENASFRWQVASGSRQLFARTEYRDEISPLSRGFSCFGCCWSLPRGSIVPSVTDFTPGQTMPFVASETLDTCSGIIGPYGLGPGSYPTPFPFSWTGSQITASSAADDDISFSQPREEISPGCFIRPKWIFGFGRAKLCKKTFNPDCFDAKKTCTSQTLNCTACKICCDRIQSESLCRGKAPHIVTGEHNACTFGCIEVYVGNGC